METFFSRWFTSSFGYFATIFPWLIVGILISFLLKKFIRESLVRALLGSDHFLAIVFAEIAGAFSPVSIIALIPLAATMLEEGANPATMAAFLLAARAYNPEALPVSLSSLGLNITLLNLVITFIAVTACALFIKKTGLTITKKELGKDRSFWEEIAKFIIYVIVGVVVAGLIVTAIPAATVVQFGGKSLLAIPLVIIFGFLVYLGFVGYFPIAQSFLDLGLSKAAVVTFISSASVVNLTFLLMFVPVIGRRKTLQIFAIYLFVIIVSAVLLQLVRL